MGGADAGVQRACSTSTAAKRTTSTGHIIDDAAHFLADDRPDAVVTHALTLFGAVL
jgi:hypothetical protein